MTTIRRLLMEVGIIGEKDLKDKLTDIEKSANSLKTVLSSVEKSLETLGRVNISGIGGSALLPQSPILTSAEQRQSDKQVQAIKDAAQKSKDREEQLIKIQENILNKLDAQLKQQQIAIENQLREAQADRTAAMNMAQSNADMVAFFSDFLQQAKVDRAQFTSAQRAPQRGPSGRFEKSIATELTEEFKSDTQRRLTDIEIENLVLRSEMEAKLQSDPSNVAQQIISQSKQTIEQALQKKVSQVAAFIPSQQVSQQQQEQQQVVIQQQLQQPLRHIQRETPQEQLQRILKGLPSQIFEREPITERQMEQAQVGILQDLGLQRQGEIPRSLQRSRIIENALQDYERQKIGKEVAEIRNQVFQELQKREEREKRGFVFDPSQLRMLSEGSIIGRTIRRAREIREKVEEVPELARERFAEFLTRRFKAFVTPQEFEQRQTDIARARASAGVYSAEGEATVQKVFNINITNPTIQEKKDIDDLVDKLTQSIRFMT